MTCCKIRISKVAMFSPPSPKIRVHETPRQPSSPLPPPSNHANEAETTHHRSTPCFPRRLGASAVKSSPRFLGVLRVSASRTESSRSPKTHVHETPRPPSSPLPPRANQANEAETTHPRCTPSSPRRLGASAVKSSPRFLRVLRASASSTESSQSPKSHAHEAARLRPAAVNRSLPVHP